jgi:hypothetical protein
VITETRAPNQFAGVLAVAVFLILAATRIPLAPKYLYYFDSVNFALALDEFNPSKHQPQPPGYPMFVGVIRLIHLVVPQPEDVLVVAGLLMITAASLMLWRLTAWMFGGESAILAVALFLFNPACWLGGITNQVRTSLAFCSTGVALLAWRALARPDSRFALYAAFAALGVGAGFRPDLSVQLLPLLLWVWWYTGRSFARLVISGILAVLAMAPWIIATAMAVSGVEEWLKLMWTYSNDQFRGSSALFGATVKSAWTMFAQATVWNFLGAIAWIWAVPFIRARQGERPSRNKVAFLLVWFVPVFLFSAFVHIGDPDQALASIPVACIVGGFVLHSWLKSIHSRRVTVTALAAACVNALLFFYPPGRLAAAASSKAVTFVDRRTQAVFNAINEVKGNAAAAIIEYRGVVTWRHISYYFPDNPVQFLAPDPTDYSWTVLRRKTIETTHPPKFLPGPKRVILIAPFANRAEMLGDGWHNHGPAYFRDVEPGAQIAVGPYRLTQP